MNTPPASTSAPTPGPTVPHEGALRHTAPPGRPRRRNTGPPSTLPRPLRRTLLVTHVAASAAWLGLSLCLLVLAVAGITGGSAAARRFVYQAMAVFGDWLVAPLALLTFGTGLVLSLGTHWGLARHRWVWTKFWLTLIAGTASLLALRPELDHAAAAVAAGEPVDGYSLLFPPGVSLTLYVFMTALSVLKPWGPTRRGRRLQAARRHDARAAAEAAAQPKTPRRGDRPPGTLNR